MRVSATRTASATVAAAAMPILVAAGARLRRSRRGNRLLRRAGQQAVQAETGHHHQHQHRRPAHPAPQRPVRPRPRPRTTARSPGATPTGTQTPPGPTPRAGRGGAGARTLKPGPHDEGAVRTQPGEGVRYGEPTASRLRLNSSGPGYPAPEAEGPKTFQGRRLTRAAALASTFSRVGACLGGRFDVLHAEAREVRAADLDLPERGEPHPRCVGPGRADSDFADPADIGRVFL